MKKDSYLTESYTELGFLSTSENRPIWEGNYEIQIIIPKEKMKCDRALSIKDMSVYPEEAEVLIPRKSTLTTLNVFTKKDTHFDGKLCSDCESREYLKGTKTWREAFDKMLLNQGGEAMNTSWQVEKLIIMQVECNGQREKMF